MFSGMTSTAITAEATAWVANYETILLVVVGVGLGFASVRFVKNLFF